ncbi:lipoprotein-releasing ABC transporter permease subunit [Woodsholea maritima]|uniref:lipoprotein-releasing ABC transporter permease subunit n=1 Tax=Woodsholea maritima TaxID=240237 RepID=UPI00036F8AA5|nr:lipoprotein-releasing ABC transporter permease subunit [Woodsholea maritima]
MADVNSPRVQNSRPFSGYEFMLAMRYLMTKRRHGGVTLISVISFVGIMLAVTALIAVMSVMNGFRSELLSRLLGAQAHVYVVPVERDNDTTHALTDQIRQIPGVNQAGPVVLGQALASSGRLGVGVQVIGVRPEDLSDYAIINSEEHSGGAGFSQGNADEFGTGHNGGNVILIGQGIASHLGVRAGDEITLLSPNGSVTPMGTVPRRKAYTVGGVITFGVLDLDRIMIFMPFEQAQIFFNGAPGGDYIEVRVDNPANPDAQIQAIRDMTAPGTQVFDWRTQNRQFWQALQIERTMMRILLSIIVAIAAMNIISGLVMLVKNKTRDIAILRTMGASQGAIMRVFLISGAAIGVLGTLAGIILGILFVIFVGPIQDFASWIAGGDVFDPSVYNLYRLPAKMDWTEVLYVSLFGFIAALLATLPPAWRASRLDPVEALRYE